MAVWEKSSGALIRNLPRGLCPPDAIAAAVSSRAAFEQTQIEARLKLRDTARQRRLGATRRA
jgi:hypothetical protein